MMFEEWSKFCGLKTPVKGFCSKCEAEIWGGLHLLEDRTPCTQYPEGWHWLDPKSKYKYPQQTCFETSYHTGFTDILSRELYELSRR